MADLQMPTVTSTVANPIASNTCPNYSVFISHRGPDVKNSFAGHLYRHLHAHGLRAFLDREELQAGEFIDPQIQGAIRRASVHIVILSPGFAESRWCLDELLLMLKKPEDVIIPVFFNVKPSEPRWAKDGRYAQALTKLEQTGRYDSQTLENWRNALKEVSCRVGFELDTYNGDEVKLLEKVVGCVLKKRRKAALQEATYATSLPVLPKNLRLLSNLRVLNLSGCSNLQTLSGSLECFTNLETLNIRGCPSLQELPDSFASLGSLQVLNLSGSAISELPASIGCLKNLQTLSLSSCKYLKRLPDSIGRLKNLLHLDLSSCKSLERLPDSFVSLSRLEHFDLSGCRRLEVLPDSFGSLSNLEHIDLSGCTRLEVLPDSFGSLTNLEVLDLSRCGSLQGLPDSFGCLSNLRDLHLSGCESLQGLPDSFGCLTNLRNIDLSGCENLRRLPDSFMCLTNIRNLNLSGCRNLQGLPVVQALDKQHGINSTQPAPFSRRFRPPIRSKIRSEFSIRCRSVVSPSAAYNSRLVGGFEFTPMFKFF